MLRIVVYIFGLREKLITTECSLYLSPDVSLVNPQEPVPSILQTSLYDFVFWLWGFVRRFITYSRNGLDHQELLAIGVKSQEIVKCLHSDNNSGYCCPLLFS